MTARRDGGGADSGAAAAAKTLDVLAGAACELTTSTVVSSQISRYASPPYQCVSLLSALARSVFLLLNPVLHGACFVVVGHLAGKVPSY